MRKQQRQGGRKSNMEWLSVHNQVTSIILKYRIMYLKLSKLLSSFKKILGYRDLLLTFKCLNDIFPGYSILAQNSPHKTSVYTIATRGPNRSTNTPFYDKRLPKNLVNCFSWQNFLLSFAVLIIPKYVISTCNFHLTRVCQIFFKFYKRR